MEPIFEVCAIKILSLKNVQLNKLLVIVTIYRAPESDVNKFFPKFEAMLENLWKINLFFF